MQPSQKAIDAALEAAAQSPCGSQRGVAIWADDDVYGVGCNDMPAGFCCGRDAACKATCSKFAVHAEQNAIIQAGHFARFAQMLHVKSVDGKLVPSGPPSCPQCSKLIVAAGIAYMWLYHIDGWRRYTAHEFHALTVEHCLRDGGHAC